VKRNAELIKNRQNYWNERLKTFSKRKKETLDVSQDKSFKICALTNSVKTGRKQHC